YTGKTRCHPSEKYPATPNHRNFPPKAGRHFPVRWRCPPKSLPTAKTPSGSSQSPGRPPPAKALSYPCLLLFSLVIIPQRLLPLQQILQFCYHFPLSTKFYPP